MDSICFPITNNLRGWSNFFHFFHLVTSKQDKFATFKFMIEMLLPVFWFFKLSMFPLTISTLNDSTYARFFGTIIYQVISPEFLGTNYFTIFLLAFASFFTLYLTYYYFRRDQLVFHHAQAPICFILQDLAPVLVNYTASCMWHYIEKLILGEQPYFYLSSAIFSFIIYNIYTFIGALFHYSITKRDSPCYSFWKHLHFFYVNLVINLVQQTWAIRKVYARGIFPCLGLSWLASICLLFWNFSFPYFTKFSNSYGFEIYGVLLTYLTLEISYYAGHISLIFMILSFFITYPIWNSFISHVFFTIGCRFYQRSFDKYLGNLSDGDDFNYIRLPNISEPRLKSLLHFALVTDYEDLHSLLIAAIDSDRSEELTIECAKMLMISSSIPHRIREKLFQIDIKKLSISAKYFLCELQYEMNKYRLSEIDIFERISFLQNEKLKTKIALYAFSNSLCDSQYFKYKYNLIVNFALMSHRFKQMCNYSVSSTPLSQDLLFMFSDYLYKCAGDHVLINKINEKVQNLKGSLIQTGEMKPEVIVSSNTLGYESDSQDEFSKKIMNQKALDSTSDTSLMCFKFLSLCIIVDLFFPPMTMYKYTNSIEFIPDAFFNYMHSPSFFKSYYTIVNIEWFLNSMNYTLGNNSLPSKYEWIGYHILAQYLNVAKCPKDNQRVINVESSELINFKEKFYNFCSKLFIQTKDDPYYWKALQDGHQSLVYMYGLFTPLIDRYIDCASSIKMKVRTNHIVHTTIATIVLMVFVAICLLYSAKSGIRKALNVFSAIETQTLDEFRSSLYVQIHHQPSYRTEDHELNDDGALDLEEIEADDYQQNFDDMNDYTELIDKSLKMPIQLSIFDPARNLTLFVYIVFIFIFRYVICFFVIYYFSASVVDISTKSVEFEHLLNKSSYLFLEISSMLSNITDNLSIYVNIPQKVNYTEKNNTELDKIILIWNNFIENLENYSFSEKLSIITNITISTSSFIVDHYKTKQLYSSLTYARETETIFWFLVFILILIFIVLYYRYTTVFKHTMKDIRRLVLVLHSKYSPTESIMINSFTPGAQNDKKSINLVEFSDTIISQLFDPVLFFNSENNIINLDSLETTYWNGK